MKRERGDQEVNEDHKSNEQQREEEAPQQHGHHKCPRCDSLNTKFFYYNNYSLSQPRHFCKDCRRFWTQGGALRNVPIGGSCRKPKRAKATRSSSFSTSSGPSIMPLKPQDPLQQKPAIRMPTIPGSTSSLSGVSQYYPSGAGHMTSPYFNQPLNHFVPPVASSNLSMFQGYNAIAYSYAQHHMQGVPPTPFYPQGSRINMEPPPSLYSPIWANATSPTTVTSVAAQAALWNTAVGNKCNTNNIAGPSSLNPNQWSDDVGGSFDEGSPSK